MMRRRSAITPLLIAVAVGVLAPGASASCLGEPCPFSSSSTLGQRGDGVLRFPQALSIGPDGNVYVGDQSSAVVQVFRPDGSFVRQFGAPGTRPGELSAVSSLAVAPSGTVVLTDGGTNRVVFFASDGSLFGSVGGSGSAPGRFRFGAGGGNDQPAGGGITYAHGKIYVSDSGNDRIQRMNLDGGEQSVLVPPGILAHPRGLAVGPKGQLVVADDHNHRLAVFTLDGAFVRSVGQGRGAGPGQLSFPFGVAIDRWNRTFVADDMNQRIVRFAAPPGYGYKVRWGSYGTAPGQLAYPRAVAVDQAGSVYVTNTGNDRIDVFTKSGTLLRSFGRSGRSPGQFNAPAGLGVDPSGLRAVADTVNGRVQLLNGDGSVATIWGSPNPGPTILRSPVDVAFDAAGNGYVLDQRRSQIVFFDRATALPGRVIGGRGSGAGQLLDPTSITVDPAGNLWVADTGNRRIARFNPAGQSLGTFMTGDRPRGLALAPDGSRLYVTTSRNRVEIYTAGGLPLGRFGYGPGRKLGQLNAPAGIVTDPGGSVWIADRGNNRIAHFTADGKRLGTFGTRGSGEGDAFVNPSDVAIDCRGTITVTDTRNNVLRQFTMTAPPAGGCGTLAPPAPPPLLRYPTLPLPDGPLISARRLRSTELLAKGIALRAGCDTACTLSVSASVSQRGLPPKRGRSKRPRRPVSVNLRELRLTLEAGTTRVVRLRPSRNQVRTLRRALAGRRGLVVNVSLTATGAVGTATTQSLTIVGTG